MTQEHSASTTTPTHSLTTATEVLKELVRLKRLKDTYEHVGPWVTGRERFWTNEEARLDYEDNQPRAWQAAFALVDRPSEQRPADLDSGLDTAIHMILRDCQELPDRNSPEDWPDAMVVTVSELDAILRDHMAALSPVKAVPNVPSDEQRDGDLAPASTAGLSLTEARALVAEIDELYAKATTEDGEWLLWQSKPPRSFEIGPSCRQITALMTNDSTEDNEFGENNGLLINALVNAWPKLRALASVTGTPPDVSPPNQKISFVTPSDEYVRGLEDAARACKAEIVADWQEDDEQDRNRLWNVACRRCASAIRALQPNTMDET